VCDGVYEVQFFECVVGVVHLVLVDFGEVVFDVGVSESCII